MKSFKEIQMLTHISPDLCLYYEIGLMTTGVISLQNFRQPIKRDHTPQVSHEYKTEGKKSISILLLLLHQNYVFSSS